MFEKINAYAKRCLAFGAGDLDYFNSLLQHKFQPKKTFYYRKAKYASLKHTY